MSTVAVLAESHKSRCIGEPKTNIVIVIYYIYNLEANANITCFQFTSKMLYASFMQITGSMYRLSQGQLLSPSVYFVLKYCPALIIALWE